MWHYGSEEAFTLLPTFLLTGLTAVALSLALLVWSVWFVHQQHGSTVLGLLFVGRFLFGGGLGLYLITFVAGFSCDIEHGKQGGSGGKDL